MIVRLLAILLFLQISTNAKSSDFGTVGLIDIPTARMSNDGTLTTSIAVQNRTKSVAITYQPMPWLETTFRYTGWKDWARWYDRNYEAKIRILEESNYMPQIAIGIRDLVGTGRWGSEYIVASKQINGIDYTFGMGWGRLAGDGDIKNPLTFLSDRFDSREKFRRAKDFGYGGKLSTDSFFSGEKVGFFGGASYKMPSLPLTLMIDYNPDEYYVEVKRGGQPSKSPVNAAVKWDIYSGTSVTFSHQHGEEWGIQFSSSMDTISQPQRQNRPYFKSSLDLNQAELPIGIDKNNWYQTLLYDVERSGILLLEATITDDDDHAVIVMGNTNFTIWQDAVAEMLKLSNKHLPKSVSRITILAEEEGHRVQSLTFPRLDSMNDINREIIQRKINIEPVDLIKVPQNRTSFYQGKIFFDYNLAIKTQFFDPDDPARYQFYAKIGARAALPNNWILFGAYSQNIYQNFDESIRKSNSVLPRVRSEIVKYLQQGDTGLDSLYVQKRGNLSDEILFRMYGGILEEMYSGLGGELLYQPFQSRLAYGFSANWVKKRDYAQSFKHLDYSTATTFASLYYATPFYNFDLALHAGKYLAKDTGATIELRRTFNNGWMVGLWATFTDVSAKDFGEGSFDKGMFFKVPLNGLLSFNRRDSYSTQLRPIQRDGGQRLEDFSGNIWWDVRSARYDSFDNTPAQTFFSGFSRKPKKAKVQKDVLKF